MAALTRTPSRSWWKRVRGFSLPVRRSSARLIRAKRVSNCGNRRKRDSCEQCCPLMRNFRLKNLTWLSCCTYSFLGLLLHLACASKPNEPLYNPERFAEVYAQILLASQSSANLQLPLPDEPAAKLARADS